MSDDVSGEIRSVLTDVLDKGPEDLAASWKACAEAGLLGLAAPQAYDGEGLGLAELGVLVREAATRARDLPFVETLVCGLLPLVRCGGDDLQKTLVPRIATGDLLLAPAVNEVGAPLPESPATRLEDDRLTGTKIAVPTLEELTGAEVLLVVLAQGTDGPVAVVVDPGVEGVERTPSQSSRGLAEATYTFTRTPVVGVLDVPSGEMLRALTYAGQLLRGA